MTRGDEEAGLPYTLFRAGLFGPVIRLLMRPKVSGRDRVPASGGVILAANHTSMWDTFVVPVVLPRPMTFPAKAELFVRRGPASWVVATFLTAVGILPMDRAGGRASANSMGSVHSALQQGRVVGIFPEGTRSPDGRLYRGKTGVARLALTSGALVVPVGLVDSKVPSAPRTQVRFGEPLDFSAYAGAGNDRDVLRYVTDSIMAAIQDLSGQRYVDAYASGIKAAIRSGEASSAVEITRPGVGRPVPPVPGSRS